MTEIIGCIAVAAGGLLLGAFAARETAFKAAQIREAASVIASLKREICGRYSPLAQAVDTALAENPESELMKVFAGEIEKYGCEHAGECLRTAAEASGLCREAVIAVRDAAAVIGRFDAAEQCAVFEAAEARLRDIYAVQSESSRAQGKMYKTLGICGGAVLAIMLI